MWPIGKKRTALATDAAGGSKTVKNPRLQHAFQQHIETRSNNTALELGQSLNSAEYLIPVLDDEMNTTSSGEGVVTVEAGSLIKFMNCTNENGESFVPAFTDWVELRKWAGPKVSAFVMRATELWQFALNGKNYEGVAINPATIGWTLRTSNLQSLLHDAQDA